MQIGRQDSIMISDDIRQRLQEAHRIVFFTGAGMSAESGIPTFRDFFNGLWVKFDPMEVASPQGFKLDPQRVWDFYVHRADAIRNASPNDGHRSIGELAAVANVMVITQNIDGLHQRAGSKSVLELHGNIFRLKPFNDEDEIFSGGYDPAICPVCDGYCDPNKLDPYPPVADLAGIELVAGDVPHCPACNALLRPDVVWFGEPLDSQVLSDALGAVNECDALVCVGCSLEVQPAASLPYLAAERGAVVIEVNPQPALQDIANTSIEGLAAEVLPALLQEVWGISMSTHQSIGSSS
jgi:NAD-dependent deacetylase